MARLDAKQQDPREDIALPVSSREGSLEMQSSTEWSSLSEEDQRIAKLGYKPVCTPASPERHVVWVISVS